MATNLDINIPAVDELMRLGNFKSKREAVDAAVAEAIAYRRQLKSVDFLGTIDFLPQLTTASAPGEGASVSPGEAISLRLPDVDIWLRAFSRQDPDPLVVHAFGQQVRQRQLVMVGLVRQALLARTRDARQYGRLEVALSGFADLPLHASDHQRAALLIHRLRGANVALSPWQALLWSIAERIHGQVWSNERHWQLLRDRGCPLV